MNSEPLHLTDAVPTAPRGFARRPFALPPEPDFFLETLGHRRAAQILRSGIARQVPVLLLTSASGLGKTMLVQRLLGEISADVTVGQLSCFGETSGELFARVLRAFDLAVPEGPPPLRLAALQSFLLDSRASGRRCLLVLDEAQDAANADLEALRGFTNFNNGGHAPVQTLLVGQDSLDARLNAARYAPLRARIGARAHLTPLSKEETAKYIRHRLAIAGGPPDVFSGKSIARIHDAAQGNPRVTNLLCDLRLQQAGDSGESVIASSLARDVIPERGSSSASPPRSSPTAPSAVSGSLPPAAELRSDFALRLVTDSIARPSSAKDPSPDPEGCRTADTPNEPPPSRVSDDEEVRRLAIRAMAALPEYHPEDSDSRLTARGAATRRGASPAASCEPPAEPLVAAPRQRPPSVPRPSLLLYALLLSVPATACLVAFVLTMIPVLRDGLALGSGPAGEARTADLAGPSAEPAVTSKAGSGIEVPPASALTTPALPTIASSGDRRAGSLRPCPRPRRR